MAKPPPSSDLRHARRERGVNAVLDTALQILMEGTERPTADEIARRAGVSTSSFFRYFTSIDDLRSQVVARYIEQHRDILQPDPPTGSDYQQRTRYFVDLRIRTATTIGPTSRQLQGRAIDEPALVPIQTRFRAMLANQVDTYFDAELTMVTPARRADLVAVIDSMTSIDAFRILTETHERSEAQVRRAWLSALDAILLNVSHPEPS